MEEIIILALRMVEIKAQGHVTNKDRAETWEPGLWRSHTHKPCSSLSPGLRPHILINILQFLCFNLCLWEPRSLGNIGEDLYQTTKRGLQLGEPAYLPAHRYNCPLSFLPCPLSVSGFLRGMAHVDLGLDQLWRASVLDIGSSSWFCLNKWLCLPSLCSTLC